MKGCNKIMKKTFLLIFLLSLFVLGLASCNESEKTVDTTKPEAKLNVASIAYVNEKINSI